MTGLETPLAVLGNALPSLAPAVDAFLASPWRVAVVGRRSVGKSSLINHLTGSDLPTGLGGVTEAVFEVTWDDVAWIDTPPIEGEARSLAMLQPLLEQIDAVVWIVDGLQPLTRSERQILSAAWVPGTPLCVLISRTDLLEEEDRVSVLARVSSLTETFSPHSVTLHDPRADPLSAPRGLSPRRCLPLRASLASARQGLAPCPADPEPLRQALEARWKRMVRAVEREVVDAVTSGATATSSQALDKVERVATRERAALLAALSEDTFLIREHGTPMFPDLRVERSTWQSMLESLGGIAAARRSVRAALGAWMLEGQLAIAEFTEQVRAHDDPPLRALHELLWTTMQTLELP